MSNRRSALGRGIGALIPGAPAHASVEAPSPRPAADRLPEIPVDAIEPNPEQPRRRFETVELDRLAESIRLHGVLQPIVVRRAGDRYELVVGERRWRAARTAGRETIPAVIADVESEDRLELALVENVQRHDLNPMELAHAFRTLADHGLTQEEIGHRVSLDRSTVANHLRLLELPRELQEDIEMRRITAGHAKALLQIANPERRRHLRNRVVREGLPVRAVERLGRAIAGPSAKRSRPSREPVDPNLQRVIDGLRERFQTRVKIQGDARRGRIEIEYFGDEDLRRITGMLLGDV
jgi:ParB family chromosome partitioning protein